MMSSLLASLAATSVMACGLIQVSASPGEAVSPTRFSGVQYNSPGSDTGSNRSLNAEWVVITNHSSRAQVMTGWKLRDRTGYIFTFPTFSLGAGRSVKIHTGSGANSRTDLYWRQGYYVWNNTGDKAILKNRSGVVVDTCSWGDGSGYTGC
jgi:hypothetical protein